MISTSEKITVTILAFAIAFALAAPSGAIGNSFSAQVYTYDAFKAAKADYNSQKDAYKVAKDEANAAKVLYESDKTDDAARDALNEAIAVQVDELIELSIQQLRMIREWLLWAQENRLYRGGSSFTGNVEDLEFRIGTLEKLASDLAAIDPVGNPAGVRSVRKDIVQYRQTVRYWILGRFKADIILASLNKLEYLGVRTESVIDDLGNPAELDSLLAAFRNDMSSAMAKYYEASDWHEGIRVASEGDAKQLFEDGKLLIKEAKTLTLTARDSLATVIQAVENYESSGGVVCSDGMVYCDAQYIERCIDLPDNTHPDPDGEGCGWSCDEGYVLQQPDDWGHGCRSDDFREFNLLSSPSSVILSEEGEKDILGFEVTPGFRDLTPIRINVDFVCESGCPPSYSPADYYMDIYFAHEELGKIYGSGDWQYIDGNRWRKTITHLELFGASIGVGETDRYYVGLILGGPIDPSMDSSWTVYLPEAAFGASYRDDSQVRHTTFGPYTELSRTFSLQAPTTP